MHQLRAEQPTEALRAIRARYGKALMSSRIRIARDGDGLRFSERSTAGKTFVVVVHHVKTRRHGALVEVAKITSQNVKPYAFVF